MSSLSIAWRNLATRPVQTVLIVSIIALGVGLALFVVLVASGMRRGLMTAGGPFELVAGPKGSATQLVVSSILLQDVPIGNIAYEQYLELRQDPRVKEAVPLALGDNVAGLRIVGTTEDLFRVAISSDHAPYYRLQAGRVFDGDFQAVLGSMAAERLGLGLGREFASSHGVIGVAEEEPSHRDFSYRVVGILAPTGTPADAGIYVPLSSYWNIHVGTGVTAVLVRARDIASAYQLYQQLNAGPTLQAALPGAVLTQFLELLGQGQRLMAMVAYVALGMALLSVVLSLYSAVQARRRDTAVLRALGASRATVLSLALWEALLQGGLGIGVGALLGHGAAAIVGALVNRSSGLAIAAGFESSTVPLLLAVLALGVGAGILPALLAYRLDPASILSGPQ